MPFGLAAACVISTLPHSREGWFPFIIPSLASSQTKGVELDLGFLNPEPAGKHGFVQVRGEKLIDGRGRELRLFGTNICDLHVMPPKPMAPRIAQRLKQLGFNSIRLHYYDYAPAPSGIMKADMEGVDPGKRDEMFWLIHQLIQNGVYVNVNLHVARGYPGLPAEGVSPMGKVVDRIVPRFIESQKSFARQILDVKSPYSGRKLSQEPGISAVEINNENSLLTPNGTSYELLHALPPELSAPVEESWNKWLTARYGSQERFSSAWAQGAGIFGRELLPSSQWILESGSGEASSTSTQEKISWRVTRPGSAEWHHQIHQMGVFVINGKSYVLEFTASGTPGLSLDYRLMHQQAPWEVISGAGRVTLDAKPKRVRFAFVASNPSGATVRLSFSTLNKVGEVSLEGLSLREGSISPFEQGRELKLGAIPLDVAGLGGRPTADLYQFMVDQELSTTKTLKAFLRNDLKVRQPIMDTQVNYGGLAGLLRSFKHDDFTDIHEYPAHPSEVGRTPEGGFIWSVPNASMLRDVRHVVERLGLWRVQGKPFMVSEFDLNPSNQYSGESFPVLSLMASLQGWSGFQEYSWLNFQQGEESPSRMFHHFSTQGNTAQLASIPFSALVFRLGLVPELTGRDFASLKEGSLRAAPTSWGAMEAAWTLQGGLLPTAWESKVGVRVSEGPEARQIQKGGPSPVAWSKGVYGEPVMTVNTPKARMIMGWSGDGSERKVGDLTAKILPGTREGYAHLLVAAMDSRPLESSKKVLITAYSRCENVDQDWADVARTIVVWGKGPVVSEPVEADVRLPGKGWTLRPLNSFGKAGPALPASGGVFKLRKEQKTLWWLAERR